MSILLRAELFVAEEVGKYIEIGVMHIIPEQREVMVEGELIELTPKEFELLLFLCKHTNIGYQS